MGIYGCICGDFDFSWITAYPLLEYSIMKFPGGFPGIFLAADR